MTTLLQQSISTSPNNIGGGGGGGQCSIGLEKSFVCEICGKGFRFRSNLAEHRSVHTAIKPFVCKFCGKSSRLKGNLTKHILKHHRGEQRELIPDDCLLSRKGKKSVKDPAAIDFIEKSMIILPHQPNSLFDPSSFGGGNNPESSVGNPESDDGEEPSPSERQFFLSLGLDGGSIDLKAECNNSESSLTGSTIGGNGDTALDELLRNSTNDQLLSKCNAAMMEEAAIGNNNNNCNEDDEDDDDGDEQMMFDNDFGGSQEAESSPDAASSSAAGHHQSSLLLDEKLSDMLSAAGSTALTLAAAKALLQKGGFGGGNNGAKSSFFGGGGGSSSSLNLCGHQQIKLENGFGGGRYDSSGTAEGRPSVDSSVAEGDNNNAAEWTLPASFSAALAALKNDNVVMNNMINNNNSSSRPSSLLAANAFGGDNNKDKGGGPIRTTQCPKCGKHMRKPRDLVTHLATIHKISPSAARISPSPSSQLFGSSSSSSKNNNGISSLFNNTSHNGNSNNNSGSGDLLLSAVAKGMVASSLRQQQQSSSSSSSFAANHQNSLQNCSSSSATAENNTTSALNGGHIGSLSSVTSELRQIKKALADMQSEGGGQQAAGHHKVEQLVLVLDSRMGRLEKQLEMALNSIYTLVQLQNGINNTLKAILAKT